MSVANGPENWWMGQKEGTPQSNEEEEVVDFQMIMDQGNKRKRKEKDTSDDESNPTTEFGTKENGKRNFIDKSGAGRKTMLLDQSLFTLDGSVKFNSAAAPRPEFSCSPIAMQSSQPELPDSQQTATASQLERILLPSARKNSLELLPPKKQRSSITIQSADQSSKRNLSPKRVSFQQQPRVMLLNPSWTLKNEHTRCLRKCVNDGFISMLKMPAVGDAFDNLDQFDSGFDFDTADGREAFMAMLSSSRSDNRPPAPLSFYAISTEKDESFCFGEETIIVPRSVSASILTKCQLLGIETITFIT